MTSAAAEQSIEDAVRKANIAPSDSLEVDVSNEHPSDLNKPPLLKHV
jgi:hypothetical protein